MWRFTNTGGKTALFQVVYQHRDDSLAMKWCKDTRPNLADAGRLQRENKFCGDLGH